MTACWRNFGHYEVAERRIRQHLVVRDASMKGKSRPMLLEDKAQQAQSELLKTLALTRARKSFKFQFQNAPPQHKPTARRAAQSSKSAAFPF